MAPSVIFDNASKCYRLGGGLPGLRDIFGIRRIDKNDRVHWAVNELSFVLEQGQALGFIGPNGAGKTTALKLLSKVTQPTSGKIIVNGRFSALIELGAGFHPDLTGRENVYLNGTILGMRRPEIKVRFDQIVDFAGIEQFIDTPVKRYSSGMYARLGFAIAAYVDPDVLLVDEVLAVGDYAFRMKCYQRMDELRANGTSLIFVSHNMADIRRVCDHAIVMYQGRKTFEGTAAEAVSEYANILRHHASAESRPQEASAGGLSQRRMTHAARIERTELLNEEGIPTMTVRSGETVYIKVAFQCFEEIHAPIFACTMYGDNGEAVYDTTTQLLGIATPSYHTGEWATITYKLDVHLLDGTYSVTVDMAYADLSCYYDFVADAINFTVVAAKHARGVANLRAAVSFERLPGLIADLPTPDGALAYTGDGIKLS